MDTLGNVLTDLRYGGISSPTLFLLAAAAIVVITIDYFWKQYACRKIDEEIADNREVKAEAATNDEQKLSRHWTDEDLFKQPPPNEECPICMLTHPLDNLQQQYQECCGKVICKGCVCADEAANSRTICSFCRSPASTSREDLLKRTKKRAEGDDAVAMRNLGCYYYDGRYGLKQNYNKALKLFLRAGELGYAASYFNIAQAYLNGEGVERDMKKAKHYYELAAMGGDAKARHNLGFFEEIEGNTSIAMKHYMIAAAAGYDNSLTNIRKGYMNGQATKDDFEKALRTHKEAKDEMKSDQRDAAADFLRRLDYPSPEYNHHQNRGP